ncbi:MAG TPA: hypothetical protein VGP79_04135, partial [Bryobacteraceae bacterium]|nr:hypothetical protein [Bryobacteraceae bacterium]
ITAILVRGALRLGRNSAPYPAFCLVLTLVLCTWNFSPNIRLILPLLPLLAISLYLEVRFLADLIQRAIHGPRRDNRVFAYILTVGLLLGACYCIRKNTIFVARTVPAILDQDRQHKRVADPVLEWCRRSLPASAVMLAFNDTYFYLKTGIKAVRPVPDSVAFYTHNRERTLVNFRNIKSFTRPFGITHILITPGDYLSEFDSGDAREIFSLLTSAPGHHEIYSSQGLVVLEIDQNSHATGGSN